MLYSQQVKDSYHQKVRLRNLMGDLTDYFLQLEDLLQEIGHTPMHSSVGANTSFASQLNFESTMFSNFKRLVNPMRLTASNMSAFAQNAGN